MRITKEMYDRAVEERVRAAEAMVDLQVVVADLKGALETAATCMGVRGNYVRTETVPSYQRSGDGYDVGIEEREVFDTQQFIADIRAVTDHDEATRRMTPKGE